jgi:hypothetical protein
MKVLFYTLFVSRVGNVSERQVLILSHIFLTWCIDHYFICEIVVVLLLLAGLSASAHICP